MTINKNDSVTLPKWLLIVFIPIFLSGITAWVTSQVTSAKYELQIANLEKALVLKSNANEVNLQFQFIKEQLNTINKKLDSSDEKLDRNEQTVLNK